VDIILENHVLLNLLSIVFVITKRKLNAQIAGVILFQFSNLNIKNKNFKK
jgi:hypothetical protein